MATTEKQLLRGGQFLVKETDCQDVFTPEDFTEEQTMMKEAVMEFNESTHTHGYCTILTTHIAFTHFIKELHRRMHA